MDSKPDAAQWYANTIAIWGALISVVGIVINGAIAYLAIGQFRAARAAEAARESVSAAHESIQQAQNKNGVNVVSPGNDYWVSSILIDLSQHEWTMVTSGKKKLVLFGSAHYDDIFGRRHESTWLYWYDSEKAGGFVSGPFSNDVT